MNFFVFTFFLFHLNVWICTQSYVAYFILKHLVWFFIIIIFQPIEWALRSIKFHLVYSHKHKHFHVDLLISLMIFLSLWMQKAHFWPDVSQDLIFIFLFNPNTTFVVHINVLLIRQMSHDKKKTLLRLFLLQFLSSKSKRVDEWIFRGNAYEIIRITTKLWLKKKQSKIKTANCTNKQHSRVEKREEEAEK